MLLIAHLVLKVLFFFRALKIWHSNTSLRPCNAVTNLPSFKKKEHFQCAILTSFPNKHTYCALAANLILGDNLMIMCI